MSPLRALDLAAMIRLYGLARRIAATQQARKADDAIPLACLALMAESRVTVSLMSSKTSTVGAALALGGETAQHWTALYEAMRARDEGRPLGEGRREA